MTNQKLKSAVLSLTMLSLSATAMAGVSLSEDQQIQKIGFGSCMKESKPKPVLKQVLKEKADLMLFIGDNIYGDSEDMSVLAAKYARLGADPDYQELKRQVPIQATWDDHDFGVNDGGAEFPHKEESKRLMLDFFEEPANSERRGRPGVYTSSITGPPGKRVQVILLDTRWFRSPLKTRRRPILPGRYVPDTNPASTFLGADQWAWLEEQLRQPAEIRLLVSSIQVVAMDGFGNEKWENFPHERTRLLSLFKEASGKKLILSGDVHRGEFNCLPATEGGLCDFTSSGITHAKKPGMLQRRRSNPYRQMRYWDTNHIGLVEIDWKPAAPVIKLKLITDTGRVVFGHTF